MTSNDENVTKKLKQLYTVYTYLAHPWFDMSYVLFLVLCETILCTVIIRFVPYTEIDWEAYMQEVDMYESGELDYRNIRGGTGPLVYPAGFLYVYSFLKSATNNGDNVFQAQVYFSVLYIWNLAIVLIMYSILTRRMTMYCTTHSQQVKLVWSWRIAMACCCFSKRIHSIFVLRLFNDGPAMLLLCLSILFFLHNRWNVGCFFFSCAVSIKMNILLFAPGLLLLLLQYPNSTWDTVVCLGICAAVQLILGAPFLLSYPTSYLRKAFELDRVFFYKWTVNWKFLSETTFVSKPLSLLLLLLHLSILAFLAIQWLQSTRRETKRRIFLNTQLSPEYIVYTMAVSNFVGIVFARTLHYQFYSWYFHTLPLLLWLTAGSYPLVMRISLLGAIEYAFNVFPATPTSSAVLQVAHLLILLGIRSPQSLGMNIVEQTTTARKEETSTGNHDTKQD